MLADVSITTVTASFSVRSGAQGLARAIASAAKAAHFNARHVCDALGSFRIHTHRMGRSPISKRKMGCSNVTRSPAHQIRFASYGFFAYVQFTFKVLLRR